MDRINKDGESSRKSRGPIQVNEADGQSRPESRRVRRGVGDGERSSVRRTKEEIFAEHLGRKKQLSPFTLLVVSALVALFLFSNAIGQAFAHGLSIFPHEIGHTVASWLLGKPATPVFSTTGFYTAHYNFGWWFKVFFLVGWGYFIYQFGKQNGGVTIQRIVFSLVILMLFLSVKFSEAMISWMGIGGEVVAAFMMGYWALSPYATTKLWRRYAYSILSVTLYVNVFKFLGELCFSPEKLAIYQDGTGLDQMTNDLHKVQMSLGISIKAQAVFLGLLTLCSLFVLWKAYSRPENFLTNMKSKINALPPFVKFAELKSKSKKIF